MRWASIARGEDLFQILGSTLKSLDLTYNKMSGLAIDGASSMVSCKKEPVALIKKQFFPKL